MTEELERENVLFVFNTSPPANGYMHSLVKLSLGGAKAVISCFLY